MCYEKKLKQNRTKLKTLSNNVRETEQDNKHKILRICPSLCFIADTQTLLI